MIFDLLNILSVATVFTGVVTLVDAIYTKRLMRKDSSLSLGKKNCLLDLCRSIFPVLLIVLLIRSFIAQPFRVPTGSLEPTVMPGDFILVTQYDYGLRTPLWYKKILATGEPMRGQIALFRWPVNPNVTFVKRVIGVPGDRISYVNKKLTINGHAASYQFVQKAEDREFPGRHVAEKEYIESIPGIPAHHIWNQVGMPATDFHDLVVPKGYYFMMGDNRDGSDDSRSWGFVSEHAFIGRARYVLLNFSKMSRYGTRL